MAGVKVRKIGIFIMIASTFMVSLGFYQIPKFECLSSECEVVRSAVVDSNVGHFLRPLPNLEMN